MPTEFTEEEIARRRAAGETIILIEADGPGDASRYVNEHPGQNHFQSNIVNLPEFRAFMKRIVQPSNFCLHSGTV